MRQQAITIERIDRAIRTVAAAMVEHDLPGLLTYIRRLEAERDRLLQQVDAIQYAKELLKSCNKTCNTSPISD